MESLTSLDEGEKSPVGALFLGPEVVLAAAREILPWVVAIRRDLHQNPELGLEEHRTSQRIQGWLEEIGIEHVDGLGGTGVLGLIPGVRRDPAVALRADIDALPIQDAKEAPYRSQVPGKMHACGHDVHTAVLLGAGRILAGLRERLPGTVKLFFQPAEETVGGAELLIEAGVMENPKVAAVFGLHVDSALEVGRFALRYGQRNAASDTIHLTLHGKSCHAAYPAGGVDAIVLAAQIVSALQAVISRNVDARDSAVISFGTIHGGAQGNIMADRVELVGTVRTLDPSVRRTVLERLRQTAKGVAAAFGGEARVEIEPGYDALINDDRMVDLARANAISLVGEENVQLRPKPNMGVEDFAYYLHHAPGAFFSFGVRNEGRGIIHSEHTERFDVDEEAMVYGMAVQVLNAISALRLSSASAQELNHPKNR